MLFLRFWLLLLWLRINHTNVELKYEPLTNEHFMFLRINHTNVELKCLCCFYWIYYCWGLIIPMWNWNLHGHKAENMPYWGLIIPMWNWNFASDYTHSASAIRINHTNVELKLVFQWQVWGGDMGLIIPMWNWNCKVYNMEGNLLRINHTNVELKFCIGQHTEYHPHWINHTNVELKF